MDVEMKSRGRACLPGCACGRHSAANRKKCGDARRGIKQSEQEKQKRRETQLKRCAARTPEQEQLRIARIKETLSHRSWHAPSKSELHVQEVLRSLSIEFVQHPRVAGLRPDIMVGDVLIEVMGCFWHGCKRCYSSFSSRQLEQHAHDEQRLGKLLAEGHPVIEIWECEFDQLNAILEGVFGGR